ncbi:MAG: NUDIX hydrolase [Xanthomonadales bacterium]|nr:NUDIX hydrolase [Xanthomonadales bacterium]
MSDTVMLHRGRFLGLAEHDGWEYVTRTNASGVVVLIPVTESGKLVLVEQYRPPVRATVIELPAGLVGDLGFDGEDIRSAAARELEEETGYSAGRLTRLLTCPSTAGMSDEQITFFLATRLERTGPGGGDSSEDIAVHEVSLLEADTWLARRAENGTLLDPKIYTALHWVTRLEAGQDAIPLS